MFSLLLKDLISDFYLDTSTDEDLEVIHSWYWYDTGRQTIPETDCRREKGSLVCVDGTILYQESLLMTSSWYTSGCQVLVCWDFDEVIDNTVHHCDFVLFSSWLKVLPTKFLQHWSDIAGSAVVIVAKPGGTPLYRLHFDCVGFC